jgi:hypothetical protein
MVRLQAYPTVLSPSLVRYALLTRWRSCTKKINFNVEGNVAISVL